MTQSSLNIAIRVDASQAIGTGHVMRCLTLAHALQEKSAVCVFFCQPLAGHLIEYIQAAGFTVVEMSAPVSKPVFEPVSESFSESSVFDSFFNSSGQDAHNFIEAAKHHCQKNQVDSFDWLIVDHYKLDASWEKAVQVGLKSTPIHILAIDDLANRPHACTILLDQNIHQPPDVYNDLLTSGCKQCIGPQYALIRDEFIKARPQYPPQDPGIVRTKEGLESNQPFKILVSFGGSDPSNCTQKVLEALTIALGTSPLKCHVTVLMGQRNPHQEKLLAMFSNQYTLLTHSSQMADLLQQSDWVIGAGGTSTWERCCMGAAAAIISIADNQIDLATQVHRAGAAVYWGKSETLSKEAVADQITALLNDVTTLNAIAKKAHSTVDGQGKYRVIEAMLGI
ncbi:MAG: UDP-2,4-diacetamido-2,4,6-trideoxy-beta-L-altropyranose hydrolase [Cyanobacteria bacterium P01_H01_bin.74]